MILQIDKIVQLHHQQRYLGKIKPAVRGIEQFEKAVRILFHFERIQLPQCFLAHPFFIDHAAEQTQQRDPEDRVSHGNGSAPGQIVWP